MQLLRLLLLASLLALAACAKPAKQACGGDGIVASNAWVRATSEGQPMSAAYIDLCNDGETADRLVAAIFDGAGAAELHQTRMSDEGVASMSPEAHGIALPAHATTALAPGGAHIMLIGVTEALEEGEEAAITLEFENAPPQTLMFEIRGMAEAAAHSGH
jgi:copper(I)-binding protein